MTAPRNREEMRAEMATATERRGSEMTCDCIKTINGKLAEYNAQLVIPIIGPQRPFWDGYRRASPSSSSERMPPARPNIPSPAASTASPTTNSLSGGRYD